MDLLVKRYPNTPESSGTEEQLKVALFRTALALFLWALVALGALSLYAWSFSCHPEIGAATQCPYSVTYILANGLMIGLGAGSVGGTLGFLFGIPRTYADRKPTEGRVDAKTEPQPNGVPFAIEEERKQTLGVNTNLEEISDWLTKILVGAGLVQLQNMGALLKKIGEQFSENVGDSELVVIALTVNSSIWGFFSGYLFTRLFLAGAFKIADNSGVVTQRLVKKAQELQNAGNYEQARTQFETAIQMMNASTPKPVKKQLFEKAVYASLYVDPPKGFQDAIKYALRYVEEEPEQPSALILAYLGFAYGQQYKYEQSRNASSDILATIRAKALAVLQKAIALDRRLRTLISMVLDPNDPLKPTDDTDNDDLEVFKDDPDFKALVKE